MTLRTQILVGAVILFLLPLAAFGQLVSRWMEEHFTTQYHQRADYLIHTVQQDLSSRRATVRGQLGALGQQIAEDNRFRVFLSTGIPEAEGYARDYASVAMGLLGLDMLQIQDGLGEILSSGHYWGMYGSREPMLPGLIASADSAGIIIETMRQEGPFLALAEMDSVRIGTQTIYLIGGIELTESSLRRLARDPSLLVRLELPEERPAGGAGASRNGSDSSAGASGLSIADRSITRSVRLSFVRSAAPVAFDGEHARARILISYPLTELDLFLERFRRWLLLSIGVLAAGSLILAFWLSYRISRPIVRLARRAGDVDLERLDTSFASSRRDEVGILARCLDQMMIGLRTSAQRLRDAEHRATMGELARQVNHDIKNGLIPIRNVLRHLEELLEQNPQSIPGVLAERRPVIDTSIVYLEDLAANYARIARRTQRTTCRFNDVIGAVGASCGQNEAIRVVLDLEPGIDQVAMDPVSLRRIGENLVHNACESLGAAGGTVRISARRSRSDAGEPGIALAVEDTGPGIPDGIRERIFDDFFTTKERGSGLGLSIVRRLVSDFGGVIGAENMPGGGARFTVWFPSRELADAAGVQAPPGNAASIREEPPRA